MSDSPLSRNLPPSPDDPTKSGLLETILESIGDGVIATDAEGCVTYLNPVAEELTQWTLSEAQGQPLDQIFKIVSEENHDPVENPAIRAIREGVIFGLANHTVLIRRNGQEIPIDDSGAPVRDSSGTIVGAVLVFREITQRRKAERAQGLLAAIIESANDAIVSKNLDGIIESWNAGAERIFEYSANEAIGKSIKIIIPADRYAEEDFILGRLRRGERIEHLETVRLTKTGRMVDIDLSVSPVRNAHSEIIGASKIAHDISRRKRLESEKRDLLVREQKARQRAETANLAKDEFIAQASHEMRTPLNSIIGWTKLLREANFEPSQTVRAVDTIERNAYVQLKLIEDLIDLAKIVQGKMQIETQPLQITELVAQALETVKPAAEAKSITIEKRVQTREGLISGDPDRMLQVLWNLLSNAVKFTPKGGRIEVSLQRLDGHLQLSITDSGIGIDPAFLPFVFDRFAQAGKGGGKHTGLGLGLTIVRYFVELHGGSVKADSDGTGKGATFTITLPSKKP